MDDGWGYPYSWKPPYETTNQSLAVRLATSPPSQAHGLDYRSNVSKRCQRSPAGLPKTHWVLPAMPRHFPGATGGKKASDIGPKCHASTESHLPKHAFSGFNMGVSINVGTPKAGRFIMENPAKIDDLGVPLFQETSICFHQFSQEIGSAKCHQPSVAWTDEGTTGDLIWSKLCRLQTKQERQGSLPWLSFILFTISGIIYMIDIWSTSDATCQSTSGWFSSRWATSP